jgi:hypothetical protein
MAVRTLRRKVIIREYDFNKVRDQAFAPLAYMGILDSLYDRASFLPLNQDNLEKLKVEEILKGKHSTLKDIRWENAMPSRLVAQFKDYLYDTRYYDWQVTIDEEGYICVQARTNTPKSRLGWGIFEKDLESRL